MGGLSLWHWIIVLLVVLILFGRGRISDIMGDFGKGIKSFKEGINEESGHAPAPPPPAQIAPQPPVQPVQPVQTVVPPVPTIVDPATGVPVPEPGMTHLSSENKTGA